HGRIEQVARPTDIYAAPATAFVAGFLGKTNVLPAAAAVKAGLAVPAQAKRLTLRPERIVFTDGPGLPGVVKTKVFQGHHWLVQVTTDAGIGLGMAPNDGRP